MKDKYSGNAVSAGVALGNVLLYQPFSATVEDWQISPEAVESERARYHAFAAQAKAELERLAATLAPEDSAKAAIFKAHCDIVEDEELVAEIEDAIAQSLSSAERATDSVYRKNAAVLAALPGDVIKERAADLLDVRSRLLRCAAGLPEANLSRLPGPVVVVARDLLPSDTATLDRRNVLAIVTEEGGPTSHSAIIARSYGIPALSGVRNATTLLADGQPVAVDALDGVLVADPDTAEQARYETLRREYLCKRAVSQQFRDTEPLTADGVRVDILLNIASDRDARRQAEPACDGVGLFRTEFLYMERDALPTEDEQYAAYKQVLSAFGGRPVTLRTLDIGGDKMLSYMELPKEQNPFLGKRALRLCLGDPALFQSQLRAAMRAAMHGNLQLMLPMVGSIEDIRRAKACLEEAKVSLTRDGLPFAPDVKVGIMVEIPSIALVADMVAREVDFASVGTNDLCQYVCAADRMNPDMSPDYYQPYHPALLRLLGFAAGEFTKAGKPLSVCGESAGDPLAVVALLGAGVRKFSMSLSAVGEIKRLLASLTTAHARAIYEKAALLPTAAEVKALLQEECRILGDG